MNFSRIALFFVITGCALSAQLSRALDLNTRGNEASDAGKFDEAIGLYRESIAIWTAAGPEYDAHRAGTLLNLGIVISGTGNRNEAARVMEQSLALHRKTLGIKNHRTLSNMNLLAS